MEAPSMSLFSLSKTSIVLKFSKFYDSFLIISFYMHILLIIF
jgi:hypothetical protein